MIQKSNLKKPEYFLSHFISLINTYEEFFATYLQPIMRKHFQRSNLALTSVYIDSTSALITALLPMLRHKIFALVPQISQQPQLLSHFIHELMSFDTNLKDNWSYDGGNSVGGWNGLTWEVLVRKDWFGRWLEVEKDCKFFVFQLLSAELNVRIQSPWPDIRQLSNPKIAENWIMTVSSLIQLSLQKPLFELMTSSRLSQVGFPMVNLKSSTKPRIHPDHYRPLSSFSHKIQFLICIQIAIFDKFHARLFSSLEAYLSLTSSIGRTVQGVSKEDQAELQGLGGLERLCRVYGSAEYLEKKMRDWSDDVFFLELWDELQDRVKRNTGDKNLAGPMSMEDVAERTSSTIGSQEDTGALFDETAGAYRRLRIRAEGILQDTLIHTLLQTLRPYSRMNPWSSLSFSDPATSITSELDPTIQSLSSSLSFLSKALAQAPLRRITRQVLLALQDFLWDNVLMRYTFSQAGISQFRQDIGTLWEVVDQWAEEGWGRRGMKRLGEALVLLELRTKNESDARDQQGLDLYDVEKRIFRSNESGRQVLEELGLETLSEPDARKVLERRLALEN